VELEVGSSGVGRVYTLVCRKKVRFVFLRWKRKGMLVKTDYISFRTVIYDGKYNK
jgi:hypothetical protein